LSSERSGPALTAHGSFNKQKIQIQFLIQTLNVKLAMSRGEGSNGDLGNWLSG
jgi:hypothetical protein